MRHPIIGKKPRDIREYATRMVNYEFDQVDRFIENAKFFDHPFDKDITAKY